LPTHLHQISDVTSLKYISRMDPIVLTSGMFGMVGTVVAVAFAILSDEPQ